MEELPSFRRLIPDLDAVLQTLPAEPLWILQQAVLEPAETSRILHVMQSQPVCTDFQVALIQLLARWGIKPQSGVIGHSLGEIAAAFAAGLLTPGASHRYCVLSHLCRGRQQQSCSRCHDGCWHEHRNSQC